MIQRTNPGTSSLGQLFQAHLGIGIEMVLETLSYEARITLILLRLLNLVLYEIHCVISWSNKSFLMLILLGLRVWIRVNLALARGIEQVGERSNHLREAANTSIESQSHEIDTEMSYHPIEAASPLNENTNELTEEDKSREKKWFHRHKWHPKSG